MLSLQKDRRNVYREAPHATPKSIPLRKKLRKRANRHFAESQLHIKQLEIDLDEAEEIRSRMLAKSQVVWSKTPDAPLGEVIARKHRRRRTKARTIPP